jgi:hypothetical protein
MIKKKTLIISYDRILIFYDNEILQPPQQKRLS